MPLLSPPISRLHTILINRSQRLRNTVRVDQAKEACLIGGLQIKSRITYSITTIMANQATSTETMCKIMPKTLVMAALTRVQKRLRYQITLRSTPTPGTTVLSMKSAKVPTERSVMTNCSLANRLDSNLISTRLSSAGRARGWPHLEENKLKLKLRFHAK